MVKKKVPWSRKAENRIISSNYRPIMCLPMRVLTTQIREEIYYSLESCNLFLEEQKVWYKGILETNGLFYTDEHIQKEEKTRKKKKCNHGIDRLEKVHMTWSRKYESENIQNIKTNCKLDHKIYGKLDNGTVGGQSLANIKNIKRQENSLSPRLFDISILPLNYLESECSRMARETGVQSKVGSYQRL